MNRFRKVLRYAAEYKSYAILNVLFNVLSVVFNLLSLVLFIPFLNLLFGETTPITEKPVFAFSKEGLKNYSDYFMSTYIAEHGTTSALVLICVLVAILFFLKNFFRYMAMYYIAVIRIGVIKDMRKKLYAKIISLPLSYYSETRKGDVITRISSDVQEVEWSIMSSLEMLFRDPMSILFSLLAMLFISPQLTFFSLLLLPVGGLVIGQIGRSLRKTSSLGQGKMSLLLSYVEETLGGLRVIKAFNAEKFNEHKFDRVNEQYRLIMLKMYRKKDLASPVSEFLGSVVMISLVYFGGSLVVNNNFELNGSEFIGYIIIFSQLLNPVKSFSTAYNNVQKGAASVERIEEILRAENPIRDSKNAVSKENFTTKIEYKNVSFAYQKEEVLKNIQVEIKKGEMVALVGQSGSGKTTFADLLPRFFDVQEGEIRIDDIPIKNIKVKDLRSLMGIVSQESVLFNDTIFNNIAFGSTGVTLEKVMEAAKIANAHEFISQMEEGYYSPIGDRGDKLSGGQKQRIAIARAILKNPPILILDEATSALDTESERLVQDALQKLMQNRTSLVVAHRLSTIQHADKIIVLHQGNIVETGTHSQLIQQNGVYKKLYDLQTFA